MTRIVIAARGTEGDVRPLIQVGRALVRRGHEVALITHCVFEQAARAVGLVFASIDTPGEYEQWLLDFQQTKTALDFYPLFQKYSVPLFPRVCDLLQKHIVLGNTLLLVGVQAYFAARAVSEKLNIPIATFLMGPGLITMNVPHRTAQWRETSRTYPMMVDINRYREAMGLRPITDVTAWWSKDNLHLLPWPAWFAPVNEAWGLQSIQTGFLTGGDPNEPLPLEVEALLSEGPPPVLLTGGTGVFVGENYYTASIEACRRLGRRVILVARRQAGLPVSLPPEVSLFPALPFASLMPRLSAVIHHGGIGTTVQALAAATPQLLLALGLDRPDNALRVERLGVGKFLPPRRWDADSAAAALASLIDQPEVQARCQELARRIHAHDGLTALIEAVESLAPQAAPAKSRT